jgi:hypothetical protein
MTASRGRSGRTGQTQTGASDGPECWNALRAFYDSGAYVNAVDDAISDDDDRVRSAYGANFERLTLLKNRYDPANLFRLNANIRPSV